MKVNSQIKKCVVFIGMKNSDEEYVLAGTGLLASHGSLVFTAYIITARHIIEGIKGLNLTDIYIKINLKNGESDWIKIAIDQWLLDPDPNVDIAIHQVEWTSNWDHKFYPLQPDKIVSARIIDQYQIDVGDELFIVGLFNHHHGHNKNIPIVRIGNIAALDEEKIQTKYHTMDGYLIQAQSIGGLSGSPVFLNVDSMRAMPYENVHATSPDKFFLMGIIYGHYDEQASSKHINTGIAIVTPVQKILELVSKHERSIAKKHDGV